MRLCQALLCWFSLVAAVIADDQIPIGSGHADKYNLTLKFDDLPTNDSGIGYDPSTAKSPLRYHDLYFQSFTVVDVAKAISDLPSPVDILCAGSAPNALFSHRRPGYPWPRFSLHPLTDPALARDPNITFTMRSVRVKSTGTIPGKPGDSIVAISLSLLKLPPDPWLEPHGFPGLFQGSPVSLAEGRVYTLVAFIGPGAHPSFVVDWEYFRQFIPGMAENVDTFEVYADFYTNDGSDELYHMTGDWEVCLDDVTIEVTREKDHAKVTGVGGDVPAKLYLFVDEDGNVVHDQDRGAKLATQLRH